MHLPMGRYNYYQVTVFLDADPSSGALWRPWSCTPSHCVSMCTHTCIRPCTSCCVLAAAVQGVSPPPSDWSSWRKHKNKIGEGGVGVASSTFSCLWLKSPPKVSFKQNGHVRVGCWSAVEPGEHLKYCFSSIDPSDHLTVNSLMLLHVQCYTVTCWM